MSRLERQSSVPPLQSQRVRRVLLIAGGGFKGAFDLPILKHLSETGRLDEYDLILGTSVGSINGVLAAQRRLDLLYKIWLAIDSRSVLSGVKGFLRPQWFLLLLSLFAPWVLKLFRITAPNALFSFAPLAAQLKEFVFASKLKTLFGVGVVPRETKEHHTLVFDENSDDAALRLGILASSAIAFVMNPFELVIGGRSLLGSDGGHITVLPEIPAEFLETVEEVDAIVHFVLDPEEQPREEVDGFLESLDWFLELQLGAQQKTALGMLEGLALAGKTVRMWAPPKSAGGLLKADAGTVAAWMELGDQVKDSPVDVVPGTLL